MNFSGSSRPIEWCSTEKIDGKWTRKYN